MPKIKYQGFSFKPETLTIINRANQIIAQYAAQGFDLTLRQLYYQFVAADLFPDTWIDPKTGSKNSEKNYKRLGDFIANGRLAGMIDWNAITDRTRKVKSSPHWDSPAHILEACASQFQIDKWARQPKYVECWIEKEALVSVLEVACQPLDVPYYACRGYNSMSEIWNAGHNRFRERAQNDKKCYILYLGDHDPSGIDMTRDVEDRINQFAQTNKVHGGDWITVKRLALNMDQIEQYNPPANPTKMTDSRAGPYVEKYGETCWELDSLPPTVIRDLITSEVVKLRDEEIWKEDVATEEAHKENLAAVAKFWDPAVEAAKAAEADDTPDIFEGENEE